MANKTKASSYPITTPYGYVKGYPINNGFHRGEDRAMPIGSDVIVNSTKIGDSGSTGASTGPHLHIGRLVGGVPTNPKGKGFTMTRGPLGRAMVHSKGYDKKNGNWIRVRSGYGVIYIYCHLNSLPTIKVGTRL